jgi:hypothetical protein
MKRQNLIRILIGIVCIGLLPNAPAVVPPPGGGYPNFNTAEGQNATGERNTANGYASLYSNTTGSQNTATGNGALYYNSTGEHNTATGYAALAKNTTSFNTAIGRTTRPWALAPVITSPRPVTLFVSVLELVRM